MEHEYRPQYSKQATAASISTATARSQIPTCSPRESCVDESGDDIIYLGTFTRQPDHTTNETPMSNPTRSSNSIQKPKGNKPTRLHHKRPDRVAKAIGGLRGSGNAAIPVSIRNKNIRIGHARDSGGQVFGFFDKAGRFRLQVEVDRSGGRADPGPFIVMESISHAQVSYSRQYQNMSRRQLRNEARRRLTAGIIGPLSEGEI